MNSQEAWDDTKLAEPTLLKYNVHTPLQQFKPEKLRKISEGLSLPLTLMLFNLNGDMNIGMSIRSAVIYGCSDVYIIGKKRYDRRPEVGAKNYIKVHRYPTLAPAFFQENKLVPVFVEQGGTALEDFCFKPYFPKTLEEGWKLCFVVGSESFGIPMSEFEELSAPIVTISQYGVMRSLNVSVATGIVLYEYCRQWRKSVAV